MPASFRGLISGLLLFGVSSAPAAVYDVSFGDLLNRSLRLNVPDGLSVVRGILIYGNGANSDARSKATDPELVALAGSFGFAVMGTAYLYNFSDRFDSLEFGRFETALQQLATMSGHAELLRAPWLPIGHSNGGQMSYGFNTLRPEKVIAIVASKGAFYNDVRPAPAALRTPGLLVAGEVDPGLGTIAIRDLFFGNRPRGALWAWVEDQGVTHSLGNSNELTLPFVEAMFWRRYPADGSPALGAVQLLPLDETEGWLTDPDSYKAGLADIAPYAAYTKDRSVAGWLPSRRLAYIFRAFASYNKAATTATTSTGAGPVAWGTTITYTIGPPIAPWTRIEFYEGDVLLKRATPGDADALSVNLKPTMPGYAVFHALVSLADGTQRTTIPRRVFVQTGAPESPRLAPIDGPARVAAGSSVTLTTDVTGYPAPTLQWSKDGIDLPGATGPSYTIPVAQTFHAGTYRATATGSDQSVASTAAHVLAVEAPTPSVTKLLNLSTRGLCLTGENVLISGFSLSGAGTKRLLIRTVGPRLGDWGVDGCLRDPQMVLRRRNAGAWEDKAANDNWGTNPNRAEIVATSQRVGAFDLTEGSADAVLLTSLPAGAYSVVCNGAANATGVALVELYDADETPGSANLVSLSTRGYVGTGGDIMIPGFVIPNTGSKTVLIRAVGPALRTYGVTNALADPKLTIYRRLPGSPPLDEAILANDNWGDGNDGAQIAATASKVGAFAFPTGSRDAALVVTLPPGLYSVHAAGADGGTGVALLEIYEVPE